MKEQARHTPDPFHTVHNPSSPCSCYVKVNGKAITIVYCHKHAAAPELLKACKLALAALEAAFDLMNGDDDMEIETLKAAIAKATEGRE